ncbi:MAG TPA: DUF998 domain-containing protein [Candidatus Limnocylindrales bacterium]|nr:DUF998 domain-containing protein [Candidatus Limnocylindrales bacterium]
MTNTDEAITASSSHPRGRDALMGEAALDRMLARRLGGVLFFTLAAQFMTVIMLAASMAPAYDFNAAAISDLGVIRETALLFNVSLVLVGVLNIAGGYVFFRSNGSRSLLVLTVLAGIGALGAGLFPLNVSELHGIFALLAFLFFNLQAIVSGAVVRGPMRVISVLAGATGLVFVVLMVLGDGGNTAAFGVIGHGGTERMIVYPAMLWMLAFGGYLMGDRDAAA